MTATRPQPRPGVLDIEAYVPGKSAAQGVEKVFKLSSNENPLGPSRRAIEAVKASAMGLEFYPDGTAAKLREALAAKYGLDPGHIVCGFGSDDLLRFWRRPIGAGDEGVMSQVRLPVYPIIIRAAGGDPVVAAEADKHRRRRDPGGDGAHQGGVPRQSEQSDGDVSGGR